MEDKLDLLYDALKADGYELPADRNVFKNTYRDKATFIKLYDLLKSEGYELPADPNELYNVYYSAQQEQPTQVQEQQVSTPSVGESWNKRIEEGIKKSPYYSKEDDKYLSTEQQVEQSHVQEGTEQPEGNWWTRGLKALRNQPQAGPVASAVGTGVADFLLSATSAVTDQIPGGLARTRASMFGDNYQNNVKFINAIPDELKEKTLKGMIKSVTGEEAEFGSIEQGLDILRKGYTRLSEEQLQEAEVQDIEGQSKTAGIPKTTDEIKGIGSAARYALGTVGQVGGLALASIPTLGTAALVLEKGEAYGQSLDELEKATGLTREQILDSNLDEKARAYSTTSGLINATLENLSNLVVIGKFVPKGTIVKGLMKIFGSRAGRFGTNAVMEGTTEFIQALDTKLASKMSTGKSFEEAWTSITPEEWEQMREEGYAGAVGGGILGGISPSAKTKDTDVKKQIVDEIANEVASTGKPEIDGVIDAEVQSAEELTAVLPGDLEYRTYPSINEVPQSLREYAVELEDGGVFVEAPLKAFEDAAQEVATPLSQQREVQPADTQVVEQPTVSQKDATVATEGMGTATETVGFSEPTMTSAESFAPPTTTGITKKAYDELRENGYTDEQISMINEPVTEDKGTPQKGVIAEQGYLIDLETGDVIAPVKPKKAPKPAKVDKPLSQKPTKVVTEPTTKPTKVQGFVEGLKQFTKKEWTDKSKKVKDYLKQYMAEGDLNKAAYEDVVSEQNWGENAGGVVTFKPVTDKIEVIEDPDSGATFTIDGKNVSREEVTEEIRRAMSEALNNRGAYGVNVGSYAPRAKKIIYKGKLNDSTKENIDAHNALSEPYHNGKLKEQYMKHAVSSLFGKVSFRKFAAQFRKHIDSFFSREGHTVDKDRTFEEIASYIIGDGSYEITEEQFRKFAENMGFSVPTKAEPTKTETTKKTEAKPVEKTEPKKPERVRAKRRAVQPKVEPKKVEVKKAEPKEEPKPFEIKPYPQMKGMQTFTAPDSKSTIYFRENTADPKTVVLENVETPQAVRDAKEKGNADKLIDKFLAEMDKRGKKVTLVVSARDKATDNKILWDWYSKKGFKAQVVNGYESDFEMERKAKKVVAVDEAIKGLKKVEKALDKARRNKRGGPLKSSLLFGMEADIAYYGVKTARLALQAGKTIAEAVQTAIDAISKRIGKPLDPDKAAKFADFIREKASIAIDPDIMKAINKFNEQSPLLGAQYEDVASRREAAATQISDFLRQENIEDIDAFAEAWNQMGLGRTLNKSDIDAIKNVMKPEGARKPFAESLVKNEAEDIAKALGDKKIKTNDLIKRLVKGLVKGIDRGFNRGQRYVNNQIDKIREVLKSTKLNQNQISAILNKLKKVNFYSDTSLEKFNDYVDNVVNNAEFAEKIREAREKRKKLKTLGRSKSLTQTPELRKLARKFAAMDISEFESAKGDRSIDSYLKMADEILNGALPVKNENYKPADLTAVNRYVNEYAKYMEKEAYRKAIGDLTEEEIAEFWENAENADNYVDNLKEAKKKELLDRLIKQAQYAQMALEAAASRFKSQRRKATIDKIVKADVTKMLPSDLVTLIRVADNIAQNSAFGGSKAIEVKIRAMEVAAKLKEKLKDVKKSELSTIMLTVESLSQVFDAIYNNQRIVADTMNDMSIQQILDSYSQVEQDVIGKTEATVEKIEEIQKKYKKDLKKREEQAKLMILAELGKYTEDPTVNIERIKDNILRSAAEYDKIDKSLGDVIRETLKKYDKLTNAEDIIKAFQKNDPHIYEMWKFLRDEVFTDEFSKKVAENTEELHNQVFITTKNYLPTTFETIDQREKTEQERAGNLSLKSKQAKSTLEARRTLGTGDAYNVNFIAAALNSYRKTMYDATASEHEQVFYELTRRPEFAQIIGGQVNKNNLIMSMEKRLAAQRGSLGRIDNAERFFVELFSSARNIGSGIALGGLDQAVLQSFSVGLGAMVNLGPRYSHLMFQGIPKGFREGVLEKRRIGLRGKTRGGTQIGEATEYTLSEETQKKYIENLSKFQGFTADLQGVVLKPLTWSDTMIAEKTWMAYYLKRLDELGVNINIIDLNKEGQKQKDPIRQRAASYADNMVASTQVPSVIGEQSGLARTRGVLGLIRNILLPFSIFPINMKVRMMRAANKMKTNPKEGGAEMAAVMVESVAFSAMKDYILGSVYYPLIEAAIRGLFGVEKPETDEEEDEEEKKKVAQRFTTRIMNDVLPFSIAWGQELTPLMLDPFVYYMTADKEEYPTMREWKQDTGGWFKRPYKSDFSELGVLGVGLENTGAVLDTWGDVYNTQMNDAETVMYSTPFGEGESEDITEVEKMILLNAAINSLTPILPREIRTATRKVYREQLKDPTPRGSSSTRRALQLYGQ
jgi:hypothetical protein